MVVRSPNLLKNWESTQKSKDRFLIGCDVHKGIQGDHELHEKGRISRIVRFISLGTLRDASGKTIRLRVNPSRPKIPMQKLGFSTKIQDWFLMGGDVHRGKQGDHELHEKGRISRIVRVISLGTLRDAAGKTIWLRVNPSRSNIFI